MTTPILAARFDTDAEAKRALAALHDAGFEPAEVSYFYVNPPGQHDLYPIGGDAHHDEGTSEAPSGAAGGAAVGAAVGGAIAAATVAVPPLGLAAAAGSVGAGAYVGALAGAMSLSRAGDPEQATPETPVSRRAGEMVAVRVDRRGAYERAHAALLTAGASEIEHASGTLHDGDWIDFDPRQPPRLIEAGATHAPGQTP